ncbi:MAG TPA: hydroxysqualene dehydroxylase HpnE [Candidatus Acidoferrales bacterium]|nr:hydroxysqualene dehydroxylase HpnE [Candidatus Acidoferrales bacterium]
MATSRVAIVGGGLAGLSAALALKERGHEVELFERTRLLGGRATSFAVDGHEVDNGQHVFLACCTEFIRFVDGVGMAENLHLQERFDVLVIGKGVRSRLRAANLPAPLHLAWSLLRYTPLRLGARLGIARALLGLRTDVAELPDETFAAWLRRNRQGAEEIRAFWDPFLVPALNVPLEAMTLRDAAFVLQTAFLSDGGAARFGWSTVPLARIAEAAARKLDHVHISTPVASLELGGAEIGVVLADQRRAFDKVVLAVPPAQAARLSGIKTLDAYEPHGILDIHLWTDSQSLDFDFAALLDSPVQWVFQKDCGYLCCSLSAADDYLTATTASLVERTWGELCAALPALRTAKIVQSAVTRNPTATYMPKPGVRRPHARTEFPNLALAGSWLETGWPDTMESAVRSGLAAADVLA